MLRRDFLATGGAALAAAALPAWAAAPAAQTPFSWDALLDAVLARSPETATSAGLDRGPRAALKHRLDERTADRIGGYRALVDAVPALRAPTTADDAISRASAAWLGDAARAFERFGYGAIGGYAYPVPYVVSQVSGAYQSVPDFLHAQHVIATADDAVAYLDRLQALARVMDQETALLRADAARGVRPPSVILERTLAQLKSFRTGQHGPEAGLVASLAERARAKGLSGDWAARAQRIVDGPVAAAAERQYAALEALRTGAREPAGVGPLPQGDLFYAACLRFHTTTPLTPDAAHALGLEQVEAISAEARAILDAQGVRDGTVAEGIKRLWTDPTWQFPNDDAGRAQVLAFIRGLEDDMLARAPAVFARLPKTPLEVRRVPPAIQLGSPGAYSQPGSLDGTRPGAIYFNLADTGNWPRWAIPTTAYHEGIPGHHFQGSIANETPGLPALSKVLNFGAYTEGWALYAEQLADELGAYEALPLGRLGRAQGSLFRACRIVVDTGLHSRGWSHAQAVQYLIEHAGSTPDDARREIERYCSWPGQACAYKIGHLEFQRLRASAQQRLGGRYDPKGFHDTVLRYGSVPLEVLGQAVDGWVRRG